MRPRHLIVAWALIIECAFFAVAQTVDVEPKPSVPIPGEPKIEVGDEFAVDLVLRASNKSKPSVVYGGKTILAYDATKLELVDVRRGDIPLAVSWIGGLPGVLYPGTFQQGLALHMFIVAPGDGPPDQQHQYTVPTDGATLIRYTFKALAPTPGTVLAVMEHQPDSWWFTKIEQQGYVDFDVTGKLRSIRVKIKAKE